MLGDHKSGVFWLGESYGAGTVVLEKLVRIVNTRTFSTLNNPAQALPIVWGDIYIPLETKITDIPMD